ncbi:hypothetical protein SAMN04488540_103300 [Ferrimonas sediminum]|uniref:Uncharacterized protein n=1 Tax=Ferrimonas sediminum TaxID=718193 RepID=A0A1G8P169_9GAMM|nr:hypothetical protein [Ferrimonas sediminum]SDI86189.1 hypothetical protein SAMN04488540_103300 [Ferrimonas sediminum]
MSGQAGGAGRRSPVTAPREILCTTLVTLLTLGVIVLFFLQQWRESGAL